MSDWTDELKQEVVAQYEAEMSKLDEEERGQQSTEVCKQIAKDLDKTTNGVRMILTKAGVYIKKTPTAKSATSSSSTGGTKRVNKAQAIEELKGAIQLIDEELIEDDVISKLTGKAAQYFTGVIKQAVALQG